MANDDDQQQQYAYNNNNNNNGGSDNVEEDEQRYCMIYDKTDFFTIFVQMLLAFFALCSLWLKRLNEVPRRTFWTWFMDVFKQGLGACYAHVCNMVRRIYLWYLCCFLSLCIFFLKVSFILLPITTLPPMSLVL